MTRYHFAHVMAGGGEIRKIAAAKKEARRQIVFGGPWRIRTADLRNANAAHYQTVLTAQEKLD